MRYAGMPMGMWIVFGKNFRKNLTEVLNYDESEGRKITVSAKKKYKELIEKLTGAMKWFCRMSGKKKYSESDINGMKATAKLKAGDRNPYSWNMDFYEYADGSGYEARFTTCGICTLMRELGLEKLIPAMCRLDYTMSEAGGVTDFVREYTLASGGPYCDCGYREKQR